MANQTQPKPVGEQSIPVPNEVVRLKGKGVVYKQGERLVDTGYDIIITPAHLQDRVFEPGQETKNTAQITGMLTDAFYTLGGGESTMRDVMTLELEDGRQFDFRVLRPDTNEIVGVSWLRR
jgi:hypothetical protein